MTTAIPPPAGGWQTLRSTAAVAAALGWSATAYGSVQGFARKSAVKYLDTRLPFALQSAVAVEEICRLVRERFPSLPKYQDDWHIKALLQRHLLTTSRRQRPHRGPSTGKPQQRTKWPVAPPPSNAGLLPATPDAPHSQVPTPTGTQCSTGPGQPAAPTAPQLPVTAASGVDDTSKALRGPDETSASNIRHEHWRKLPVYHVVSYGHSLWVHPNTGVFSNLISRSVLNRLGMVAPPQLSQDSPPQVRFEVDFAGLKEELEAAVVDPIPNDVDLVLGMHWIKKHEGRCSWGSGHFFFVGDVGNSLYWFRSLKITV